MEDEAYDPVRLHAPDEHLGDREGEVRRKPQLEAERVRGIVRKVLSREKHPVVEDPGASEKRPVKTAGEPRDQACGDPVREPPDDACEHRPKKKGTPEGTFLRCWEPGYDYPRQEPGRNFGFKLVPSMVLFPQRQPKTVFPPTSTVVIGTGGAPAPALFSGTRVTTVPLIPVVGEKPCIVTVTLPLTSV